MVQRLRRAARSRRGPPTTLSLYISAYSCSRTLKLFTELSKNFLVSSVSIFSNNWPTLKVSKRFLVNCSDPSPILPRKQHIKNVFQIINNSLPATECAMITAVDVSQKILVMTFRATLGNTQLGEEVLNFLVAKKQFFDVGKVFEFFYDAYLALWRAGLEQEIRSLKYRYPDYELWVRNSFPFKICAHNTLIRREVMRLSSSERALRLRRGHYHILF